MRYLRAVNATFRGDANFLHLHALGAQLGSLLRTLRGFEACRALIHWEGAGVELGRVGHRWRWTESVRRPPRTTVEAPSFG